MSDGKILLSPDATNTVENMVCSVEQSLSSTAPSATNNFSGDHIPSNASDPSSQFTSSDQGTTSTNESPVIPSNDAELLGK